jgi:hypothetical protein
VREPLGQTRISFDELLASGRFAGGVHDFKRRVRRAQAQRLAAAEATDTDDSDPDAHVGQLSPPHRG